MVSTELAMLSQLALLWLISADSLTQPVNIQDFTHRELQLLHNLINREVTRSRILKYRIGQVPRPSTIFKIVLYKGYYRIVSSQLPQHYQSAPTGLNLSSGQ